MNEFEFASVAALLARFPALASCAPTKLYRTLPRPTLLHISGRRRPALFLSILLHGNEPVGLRALQQLLAKYRDGLLPRALTVLVGNVAAARQGVRRLEGQPDFNRVWPGGSHAPCAETEMMAHIVTVMRERGVFASIDLHNNTGLNPHYVCLNRLDREFLHLASLFGRTVVYCRQPVGVQTLAFSPLCPAVICECGRVDDACGAAHACAFVDACLHLEALPQRPVRAGDLHLFHTVATLKVPETLSMSFDGSAADLRFPADFDRLNFVELDAGTELARCAPGGALLATDDDERDISAQVLSQVGGVIALKRSLMPAMLTLNQQIIRQDCLGYLMERMEFPAGEA